MSSDLEIRAVHARIMAEVLEDERRGLVVTVTRVPCQPLAMGHAQHQVEVRESLAVIRAKQVIQAHVSGRAVPLTIKDYITQFSPPRKKQEL